MRRSLMVALGSTLAAFLLGCGATGPSPLEVGDAAPVFTLARVGAPGDRVTTDSLRGRVTVLNFWSTTCGVCRKEVEDLNQIHEAKKALVVGIALDEDPDSVRRFVEDEEITYPMLMGNENVFGLYDGFSIPYTIVLDRTLKVRKKVNGLVGAEELARLIDEVDES